MQQKISAVPWQIFARFLASGIEKYYFLAKIRQLPFLISKIHFAAMCCILWSGVRSCVIRIRVLLAEMRAFNNARAVSGYTEAVDFKSRWNGFKQRCTPEWWHYPGERVDWEGSVIGRSSDDTSQSSARNWRVIKSAVRENPFAVSRLRRRGRAARERGTFLRLANTQ